MSEEKKLTYEEVVKALECCAVEPCEDCGNCPRFTKEKLCHKANAKQSLDLIHRLQEETEKQYKRIMELEQDLVHADEKVFYRECDVALNEKKLKNKGALELAQKVEAYLAYYQGESFTTEQILDIIKQTLIEDFNFKEQTNEN